MRGTVPGNGVLGKQNASFPGTFSERERQSEHTGKVYAPSYGERRLGEGKMGTFVRLADYIKVVTHGLTEWVFL